MTAVSEAYTATGFARNEQIAAMIDAMDAQQQDSSKKMVTSAITSTWDADEGGEQGAKSLAMASNLSISEQKALAMMVLSGADEAEKEGRI